MGSVTHLIPKLPKKDGMFCGARGADEKNESFHVIHGAVTPEFLLQTGML